MNEYERFSIFCEECEDVKNLIPDTDSGTYRCVDCSHIYYDEDGVFDQQEAMQYYDSYRGAKLAGLIPEPDVPRESWGSNRDWDV